MSRQNFSNASSQNSVEQKMLLIQTIFSFVAEYTGDQTPDPNMDFIYRGVNVENINPMHPHIILNVLSRMYYTFRPGFNPYHMWNIMFALTTGCHMIGSGSYVSRNIYLRLMFLMKRLIKFDRCADFFRTKHGLTKEKEESIFFSILSPDSTQDLKLVSNLKLCDQLLRSRAKLEIDLYTTIHGIRAPNLTGGTNQEITETIEFLIDAWNLYVDTRNMIFVKKINVLEYFRDKYPDLTQERAQKVSGLLVQIIMTEIGPRFFVWEHHVNQSGIYRGEVMTTDNEYQHQSCAYFSDEHDTNFLKVSFESLHPVLQEMMFKYEKKHVCECILERTRTIEKWRHDYVDPFYGLSPTNFESLAAFRSAVKTAKLTAERQAILGSSYRTLDSYESNIKTQEAEVHVAREGDEDAMQRIIREKQEAQQKKEKELAAAKEKAKKEQKVKMISQPAPTSEKNKGSGKVLPKKKK